MSNIKIFVSVLALLVVGVIATVLVRSNAAPAGPGKYDTFAKCLGEEGGATFFGAFWCPHCAAQKKMFGASAKLLPYVECSTADGKSQTQACIDKGVESYPTWDFKDGSRLTGEVTFEQLVEKTSCTLPTI